MDDRLRRLWNFDDLAATEDRLRDQLVRETTGELRAEVLTQLARIRGLHGDFDAGEQLVEEAEATGGASPIALTRIDRERRRLLRSNDGRSVEAVPLLEQATTWAIESGAPDGSFHEELAAEYAAIGRHDEAYEHGRLALPLLLEADPSFVDDADRSARRRQLAGER